MSVSDKLELLLHAGVTGIGIIAVTILGALKVVDGNSCLAVIAGLGGVNGAVTGIATVKSAPARQVVVTSPV